MARTRVAKDPEVRRNELIDIAEELFLTNGYEETAVSDIVKKAEVAQGTFYYYFKSKDEILDAIADRWVTDTVRIIETVAANKNLNAVEKMLQTSKEMLTYGLSRRKIVDYIHEEQNAHLHLKLERKSVPNILPQYMKIIEQGVTEGFFDIKYPKEATIALLSLSHSLDSPQDFDEDSPELYRKLEIIYDLIERILGAQPGIFMEYTKKLGGLVDREKIQGKKGA